MLIDQGLTGEQNQKAKEMMAGLMSMVAKYKDSKYVVDDKFQLTPDEILFDLNRTGEFAGYEKNWRYRNTRGAGMGKAIMPYSGETIGVNCLICFCLVSR